MSYDVYVGSRLSDTATYEGYFKEVIVYHGKSAENIHAYIDPNNRTYYLIDPPFLTFIAGHMTRIIDAHPDSNFYFYSSRLALKLVDLFPQLQKYLRCVNDLAVVNMFDDKTSARNLFSCCSDELRYKLCDRADCRIETLNKIFGDDKKKYVVQASSSSGGEETFLLTRDNEDEIQSMLIDEQYIVSDYVENGTSLSFHVAVFHNDIIIFPPNVQLAYNPELTGHRMIHKGNDYANCLKNISKDIVDKLYDCGKKIGGTIRESGYRGICGIDLIADEKNSYFLEINPRFLGSSFLIERALADQGLPPLLDLHIKAFNGEDLTQDVKDTYENLRIPYRSIIVSYYDNFSPEELSKMMEDMSEGGEMFADGFVPTCETIEKDAYLFRVRYKDE